MSKRVATPEPGTKFGRLYFLEELHWAKYPTQRSCLCLCECGTFKLFYLYSITGGKTLSCGCLHKEKAAESATRHGKSKSTEHIIWMGMKSRCTVTSDNNYPQYGARGIRVCDRWLNSFEAFYEDMGPRPKGMTLDRINNEEGYSPENCRWATPRQQSNNTRRNRFITYNGKSQTIAQWAREVGLPMKRLHARIQRGWTAERALTQPLKQ